MSRQVPNILANGLTVIFGVLTLITAVVTLAIAGGALEPPLFAPEKTQLPPTVAVLLSPTAPVDAQSAFNASPTGLPVATATPTLAAATPTPTLAPPTASPTVAPSLNAPTSTRTPLPTRGASQPTFTPTSTTTWTPSPQPSPLPLGPSATPTPSLPFVIQPGTPMLRTNFANADGCNWQGIAGLVVDGLGDPVLGVRVMVSGLAADTGAAPIVVSGTNTFYGLSGWEVKLGSVPDNSRYSVMLVDEDGTPLSLPADIVFPAACEQNLALVNFVQIRPF